MPKPETRQRSNTGVEEPSAPPPYLQDPPPYEPAGQPTAAGNPSQATPVSDGLELCSIPSAPPLTDEDERPTYLPGTYPASITYQPQPHTNPQDSQYYSYYRPMPEGFVHQDPKHTVYLVRSGEGDECYQPMTAQTTPPSARRSDDLDWLSACCASAVCAACLSCFLLNAS